MKIQILLPGACLLALFPATGHAQTLSNADKQFMIMAAKTDMTEAHIGQMAENQANRPEVKDFAKALVQDHTDSYVHLNELAGKTGVSIPKGIDSGKDSNIQLLGHLKGATFDRTFERDEIASHRRALELFKREAAHAQNPDVKAYATSKIPVLEKHLHLAEECAKPAKRS